MKWIETELICMHEQLPKNNSAYQSRSSCSTVIMTFWGIPLARYSRAYTQAQTHTLTYMHAQLQLTSAHTLIHSFSHNHTAAVQHSVTAVSSVWHQLSCLIISFSERCPVPPNKNKHGRLWQTNSSAEAFANSYVSLATNVHWMFQKKVSNNAQETLGVSPPTPNSFDQWIIRSRLLSKLWLSLTDDCFPYKFTFEAGIKLLW